MSRKLNDRQCWLLVFLLSRYPSGVAENTKVGSGCQVNGRWYGSPGGIGMANIRGLQKRGLVNEPRIGIFYLTENGVLAAQDAANDERWAA